jgi:23S rRNA pseudouridine1911/1915/1917 synthase
MTIATGGKKGRAAVTHFQVRQSSEQFSFLEVEIETGRTHQIRVHLEAIGHPLVLDPLYGNQQLDQELIDEYSLELKRIFLHSWKLEIKLPNSKNPQTFEAKLPMDLRLALENLQKMHQG